MKKPLYLTYEKYYLKNLTTKDVSKKYLKWVKDKEVARFLEIRYNKYTLKNLYDYVKSFENNNNRFLFGILTKEKDEHIGNATIYNIYYNAGTFDMGYFIGEKKYWGKNASVETILMLLKFGFEDLRLRKFFGGLYANNVRNRFVLKKMGFTEEARLRGRWLFEGKPVDQVIYTLDRKQWVSVKKKFSI